MLDFNFYKTVGVNVVNMYRKHIFDKGKDIDGKKFKAYTSKEYSDRKKANKFRRQSSAFANTTSPVLTGDLYRDFKLVKTSKKGFRFGTVSWGAKVEALKKLNRNLYTGRKVLPTHVSEYFDKEAKKYTERKMKKIFKGGKFKI